MRILTTLLALLLASPVFAETYVCSWLVRGDIATLRFTRAANGFDEPRDDSTVTWDIVHESESVLVLHRSVSLIVGIVPPEDLLPFVTQLAQIEKGNDNSYVYVFLTKGVNVLHEGTCTVVE